MNKKFPEQDLAQLRREVDIIDSQLLLLIKRRTQLASEMGVLKKKYARPLQDAAREEAIVKQIRKDNLNSQPVLNEEFLIPLFRHLMALGLDAQH